MTAVPFTKMQGCGNEFVVVYREDLPPDLGPDAAPALCDRQHGIGADGVLVIDLPEGEDGPTARMTVWNADGTLAEMCGNGLRCVVRRLAEDGRLTTGSGAIQTGAGLLKVSLDGAVITVEMGVPDLTEAHQDLQIELANGSTISGRRVSMGNPHFVVFADEQTGPLPDLTIWGPQVEVHPAFPDRTNIEWVQPPSRSSVSMRVWERGVGETRACGSGACAVAVTSFLKGRVPPGPVAVFLPGGRLEVDWPGEPATVTLSGPAQTVRSGTWRGAP